MAKLVKQKTNGKGKQEKKNPYVSIPFANKMYEAYLDRDKAEKVKKRNMVNDIISSVLTSILILWLGFQFGKEEVVYSYTFFGAGVLVCLISALFAAFRIYKGDSRKQNITKIIVQAFFLIIFVIEILGTK